MPECQLSRARLVLPLGTSRSVGGGCAMGTRLGGPVPSRGLQPRWLLQAWEDITSRSQSSLEKWAALCAPPPPPMPP